MGQVLEQLIKLLNLERLSTHLFRGHSEQLGLSQVFGGQVVGQALSAAKNTIDAERQVHSFHSYFLHPGDCSKPIDYEVEVLRDGRSLSARRVKAVQDGQPIFYMTASFQGQGQGFSHQSAMPDCPGPEQLLNEQQLIKAICGDLPAVLVNAFSQPRPLEIRPVTLYNPVKGHISAPVRQVWIRANGQLPDRPWLHQALLGYASDLNFLPVSLQPHGKGFLEPDIQVATVDHSMWFHRPVDLSQWLLYDIVSPSASGSRGFVRGEFYSQQGELIASAVQEGIIRLHKQA